MNTSKSQLLHKGRTHSGYKLWRTANIIALMILFAVTAFGQNAQRDEQGNFIATSRAKAVADSTTTFTFTDAKGIVHPVFVGAKGAFFIGRVSAKSGNYYRFYLKTEKPADK
jgi:hypothetical protein